MQVEKTVFISYRRTNAMTAQTIYQNLTLRDYDCFLHPEIKPDEPNKRIILNEIKARAHFLVLLTPYTLKTCAERGDWLRTEIDYALLQQRNIIPLLLEGFDLPSIQKHMTATLAELAHYDSLSIETDDFDMVMARLRTRFLRKPVDVLIQPSRMLDRPALAEIKTALQAHPPITTDQLKAEVCCERGLNRVGDLDAEIEDYSQAILIYPSYALAYSMRGSVFEKKKDVKSALSDYNKAINLDSQCEEAYYSRAYFRVNQGQFLLAIVDYTRVINLNPQNEDAFYNRGRTYDEQRDFTHAIADYTEAIRLDADYAEAYNNRGYIYYRQNDLNSALADYTEAIRSNPNCAHARNNRGRVYWRLGELQAAAADYTEGIRIYPHQWTYFHRGRVLFNLGQFEAAIADYTEAIRLKPDALTYHNRGRAYQELGQLEAAAADYKEVIKLNPNADDSPNLPE